MKEKKILKNDSENSLKEFSFSELIVTVIVVAAVVVILLPSLFRFNEEKNRDEDVRNASLAYKAVVAQIKEDETALGEPELVERLDEYGDPVLDKNGEPIIDNYYEGEVTLEKFPTLAETPYFKGNPIENGAGSTYWYEANPGTKKYSIYCTNLRKRDETTDFLASGTTDRYKKSEPGRFGKD